MAMGSIVDYLNQNGQDSSYQARKRLAEQYGIQGYRGTAAQNTQLLGSLQSGAGAPKAGAGVQAAGSPTAAPGTRYANGGVQALPSPNVTAGMDDDILDEDGSSSGSSSSSRYLTGYSYDSFSPSSRTSGYADTLEDLENNKPGPYNSRWQAQIDGIVDGIMNRPKFETDDVFDSDLYKTYREQYINQGQRAMRDATGNAANMTGGYGSTYAAAAGQQAYDNYLSQLNDRTLDIYDRVYNQYLQEGQELYNQLGMLNNQDSIEYGRYRDDVSDYYRDLDYYAGRYDQSYNADFGEWQADLNAQQWAEEYAYQKTQDELAQQNWQAQFDYQKEQDAYDRWLQEQQLALQQAKAGGSGGGGGSRRSSGSSKKSSSTKESTDGYAPIAANVVQQATKNGWGNAQSYNYVMQLGEQGKISQGQVDKILKAAGIDEEQALRENQDLANKIKGYQALNRYSLAY